MTLIGITDKSFCAIVAYGADILLIRVAPMAARVRITVVIYIAILMGCHVSTSRAIGIMRNDVCQFIMIVAAKVYIIRCKHARQRAEQDQCENKRNRAFHWNFLHIFIFIITWFVVGVNYLMGNVYISSVLS